MNIEVAVLVIPDVVPLLHEFFDIFLDRFNIVDPAHLNVNGFQVIHSKQSLLCGGDGDEYLVIGIKPGEGAFGHGGADNQVILTVDLDGFTDRIRTFKQVFIDRGTKDCDTSSGPNLFLIKIPAAVHLEIRHPVIVFSRATNCGIAVFVSIFQLRVLVNLCCDAINILDLVSNGVGVLQLQSFHVTSADVPTLFLSRFHRNDVGSEFGNERQGFPLGTFTQ